VLITEGKIFKCGLKRYQVSFQTRTFEYTLSRALVSEVNSIEILLTVDTVFERPNISLVGLVSLPTIAPSTVPNIIQKSAETANKSRIYSIASLNIQYQSE
jgi:hypothetical protein